MYRTVLFFLFLYCFLSCVEPVDLLVPEVNNQLAVVCHFSPLDTLELVLSRGHPVAELDVDTVDYVSDAQISIFSDGLLVDILSYQEPGASQLDVPPHYKSSYFVPQEGKTYSLRVVVPGEEEILTAQSYVPQAVGIIPSSFAYYLDVTSADEFSFRATYEVSFAILDPEETENFYHLSFYQKIDNLIITPSGDTLVQTVFTNPLKVESENTSLPLTPYIENRGYLFKDDFFSGAERAFSFSGTFLFSKANQQLSDFIVELRTVTKEYYQYHTALARYARSLSDPLALPVLVPGNVENGQGIFTGFSSVFYAL